MDIPWHEYSGHGNCPITEADLTEKASIVGRVGLMLLSCGTGAWRVRSSMNTCFVHPYKMYHSNI